MKDRFPEMAFFLPSSTTVGLCRGVSAIKHVCRPAPHPFGLCVDNRLIEGAKEADKRLLGKLVTLEKKVAF